jgi:lipopolysaccharide exporter
VDTLKRLLKFLDRSDGSLHHKAFRSGVWVGISSIGTAGLTFARGIVLARLLTPEIFGLMALCLMATRLIEIMTETGFGAALIHRQERFEDARDTAFTLRILRGVALAILSFAIAPFVANFYGQPALGPIIGMVGLSFVLTGLQNINTVALQKELDFKRLTYMDLTGAFLSFVVSVTLSFWLRSVWALAYAQVATAAIHLILSFVMVPGCLRVRLDLTIARELYRYGRFITGLGIVVFISRELDNAVIGKLLGPELLGYYVAAYSLANLPSTYVSKIVAKVLFPMFSKLQDDLASLRVEYERGIRLVTAFVVPVSITMGVLAPEIVHGFYGPRWAAVTAPLQVLVVFGCFRALWMLNGYLYNAIGKPHIDFYTNLLRLVLMTALLFPLTFRHGIVGASLAVTLPMVAQFVLGVVLSRRYIQAPASVVLRPLGTATLQGSALCGVLLAAKHFVPLDPRVALVGLLALGGAVCVALNARQIRSLISAHGIR